MAAGMILTSPDYDPVTKYFFEYSKKIKKTAFKKGIKIKELSNSDANPEKFGKALYKLNYSFIFLNGHGGDNSVAAHKDETILSNDINFENYGERLCYCRSCNSAKELGKKLVLNGGAFIGYENPFRFYVDDTLIYSPLKDKLAKLYLEPSNLVPLSILKGHSAKMASQKSKTMILKNIKKVLRDSGTTIFAVDLWRNYESQIVLGEENLTIHD